MTLIKKTALAACISATLVAATMPSYAADKNELAHLVENVKIDHDVFTLPNGLTTLVIPDHENPRVHIGLYFDVGSKDEPEGQTGFAHLYEHLLFQGTKNAPGEFFSHMNALGASGMNGSTGTDSTQYYETVPTGALDRALWLESDRMANIVDAITQELLDEQRDVVKNEKREGEQGRPNTSLRIQRELFYPEDHPYHHSIIGSMEDLAAADLEDVQNWYKDMYGAKNLTVILAGDITVEQAKKKMAKYFSDMPSGVKIPQIAEYVPRFDEIKRVKVYEPTESSTTVLRMWHVPPSSTKENVLLTYLSVGMGGIQDSALTKRLKDELGYVDEITFGVGPGAISGKASLQYSIREEAGVTKAEIDKVIDEELAKVFKNGPDMKVLQRYIFNQDAGFVREMNDTGYISRYLLTGLRERGNPEFFKVARRWERETNRKELTALARKWIDQPYFELTISPNKEPVGFESTVDRSTMPEVKETVFTPKFPEFQQATLDNGMKVVLVEDHDTPSIQVRFEFATGGAADYQYTPGTAKRVFQHLRYGTQKYNEEVFREKQADIASFMGGAAKEETSSFGFNALTPYLDDAFVLAKENLLHPAYPLNKVEEAAEKAAKKHDRIEVDFSVTSGALYKRLLWGKDHEFGRVLSREDEVASVSREQMVKFHKNELGPNNVTVWFFGDITLDKAKKALNKHFGKWKKVSPTPLRIAAKPQPMKGKVVIIDLPGASSTNVKVGHLVPKFDLNRDVALDLGNGPFAGYFESRVNMNLREDKAWSYGVRGDMSSNPFEREGQFQLSTAVQADKTGPAIKEILSEITALLGDKPLTQAELDRYRDFRIKAYPSRFGDKSKYLSAAITANEYGLPFDFAKDAVQRMEAVKLPQVNQVMRETIDPSQLSWMFIGDRKVIESQIRNANIGDVEVWDHYGNRVDSE